MYDVTIPYVTGHQHKRNSDNNLKTPSILQLLHTMSKYYKLQGISKKKRAITISKHLPYCKYFARSRKYHKLQGNNKAERAITASKHLPYCNYCVRCPKYHNVYENNSNKRDRVRETEWKTYHTHKFRSDLSVLDIYRKATKTGKNFCLACKGLMTLNFTSASIVFQP